MNKALMTPYVCFANALIANAPQSYKKSVRIYTLRTISCETTEILIHLIHDKGKKQRFLHYPYGNIARNAVVIIEVKMVLRTWRGGFCYLMSWWRSCRWNCCHSLMKCGYAISLDCGANSKPS